MASSQYYPLVKVGTIWREASTHLVNPPSQFVLYRYQYLMNGDTVINNQAYKKVFSTDYDSLIHNPVYIGAIRESSDGKVFVRYDSSYNALGFFQPDTSEYLLYDFSLSPNDTFLVSGVAADSIHIVDYIDSVNVGGAWRKRIYFIQNSLSERIWIEGIGSLKGLFFPHLYEFENYNQLICYEDSALFWTHPDVTFNCLTVGMDEEQRFSESNHIQIFPNPSNSVIFFRIEKAETSIEKIIVRDMEGRAIKFVSVDKLRESQIPIQDMQAGIYIMEFWLSNGARLTKKFIKHI